MGDNHNLKSTWTFAVSSYGHTTLIEPEPLGLRSIDFWKWDAHIPQVGL